MAASNSHSSSLTVLNFGSLRPVNQSFANLILLEICTGGHLTDCLSKIEYSARYAKSLSDAKKIEQVTFEAKRFLTGLTQLANINLYTDRNDPALVLVILHVMEIEARAKLVIDYLEAT